jgi:NTP pyrophosphatase (non-canonical NTP hydrolase)
MSDATTTVESLKEAVRAFTTERHWGPFHTPKNLSMALATEVAELMEHFLWLTGEESQAACADPTQREAIADEVADVTYLLLNFSIHTGIDLSEAFHHKMSKNVLKYPVVSGEQ